jgi:hypothetical protein
VYKFGYENQEEYIKDAQKKFSLLESGILGKPSARLLIINVCSFSLYINMKLTDFLGNGG